VVKPACLLTVVALALGACSGLERGRALGDDLADGVDARADVPTVDLDAAPDEPTADDAEPLDAPIEAEATPPAPCDDHDPCTVDGGTSADACTHWPAPDGSACGEGRQCLDGACVTACWQAPCPPGLEVFDGCRCRVPASGLAADRCLTDQGLTPCETIAQGSAYQGQDAHVDGRSLHVAFTNPWTTDDDPPADNVTDLRTGLRWSLLQGELPLADAEAACAALPGFQGHLPTLAEALTLLDAGAGRCPWLDPRLSAACPKGPFRLWTSTRLPWDADRRFVVTATGPSSAPVDTAQTVCALGSAVVQALATSLRYDEASSQSVVDRATGLQWRRDPACAACTWSEALATCRALPGEGWHLATARELWSLLRIDHLPPLVDDVFAGDLRFDPYADGTFWTSSPFVLLDDATPRALTLDLRTGTAESVALGVRHAARCVRIPPLGVPRTAPEARANALTPGDQATSPGRPALAALRDGGFVLVWLDRAEPEAPHRVMARRFDALGRPLDGVERALNPDEAGDASEPTVAVADDGTVLVAWEQRAGQDPAAIMLRALGADGAPAGQVWALVHDGGASRRHPSLAAVSGHGFALAYDEGCDPLVPPLTCTTPQDTGQDVNVVRLATSGQPLADPLPIPTARAGDQSRPALATLPEGLVAAVWLDHSTGAARVRTRILDPDTGDGTAEADAGMTNGEMNHPAVFAQRASYVVLWEHRKTPNHRYRAIASQFVLSGDRLVSYVYLSYTPHNQGPVPSTDQRYPQGASGVDHGFVVSYDLDGGADYLQSPNDHDGWAVATQPFTEWMAHDGPPRRENAHVRGDQAAGSIVLLPDGQQVVAWTGDAGGGMGRDVWFRRSEASCHDGQDNDLDDVADDADPDCVARSLK
jgi:hypothetical protein